MLYGSIFFGLVEGSQFTYFETSPHGRTAVPERVPEVVQRHGPAGAGADAAGQLARCPRVTVWVLVWCPTKGGIVGSDRGVKWARLGLPTQAFSSASILSDSVELAQLTVSSFCSLSGQLPCQN